MSNNKSPVASRKQKQEELAKKFSPNSAPRDHRQAPKPKQEHGGFTIRKIVEPDHPNMTRPLDMIPLANLETKQFASRVNTLVGTFMDSLRNGNPVVGLAANQIGFADRMFVALLANDKKEQKEGEEEEPEMVIGLFLNPIISEFNGDPFDNWEGCLSYPGQLFKIMRVPSVKLHYLGLDGSNQSKEFHGLNAIVVQHEVAHLNGIRPADIAVEAKKVKVVPPDLSALKEKGEEPDETD